MILLVGLGNPGARYANNRHNIGFMAIDAIRDRFAFGSERSRFQGLASEGNVPSGASQQKTLALKPTTFMNESGRAVSEAMRFYRIPIENIIVFYDEIDLAPGKVRVKTGGGHAGHNGMRSLYAHIGSEFRRVRMGIGRPEDRAQVHRYVLQDFAKADRDWLNRVLEALADATPLLIAGNDAEFMNRTHLALQAGENSDTQPPDPATD